MRVRTLAALTALAAASAAAPVVAPARAALTPDGPGPASFMSDNVQWVSVNPAHTGSSGGRLHGGYFYVTDPRAITIYDVSNPAAPTVTGRLVVPQSGTGVALGQEDPDTNGKILLVDAVDPNAASNGARLLVVDVQDKTAPKVIANVNVTDHTWSCVLDCTYAYGRTSGSVIDLRDPANPKNLNIDWRGKTGLSGYTHDFTEVAPGRLMSAGQPSGYIDASNPASPKLLTRLNSSFSSLGYHGAQWAQNGRDPFLVMGTEISPLQAGSDCQGTGVEIATYDTSSVLAADDYQEANPGKPRPASSFKKLHTWRVSGRGVWADGNAPGNTLLYCGHWFDLHPDFEGGGLVAMGYYDWGTRFLRVHADGKITEVGWFQPVGGVTSAAYWVSKDIVYALDYRRGLEILKFTEPPA